MNSGLLGQNLESTSKIESLELFYERKNITFRITTKTIVASAIRRHKKRRRLLIVKGALGLVGIAGLLELEILADDFIHR